MRKDLRADLLLLLLEEVMAVASAEIEARLAQLRDA